MPYARLTDYVPIRPCDYESVSETTYIYITLVSKSIFCPPFGFNPLWPNTFFFLKLNRLNSN